MAVSPERTSPGVEPIASVAQGWVQLIGRLASLPAVQRLALEDTGRETLLWVVLEEDPEMSVSEQIWRWEQPLRAGPDAGIDLRLVSLDRTADLSPPDALTIMQR